ncbi:hypothetical protein ACSAZK_16055 [Methanosarcina sp. Mfa9]|uniref:hypothetical protein n=1 Tax=Methanosarcina sp. Mfa9 TaxID=3439063 RepID=UPI003F849CB9
MTDNLKLYSNLEKVIFFSRSVSIKDAEKILEKENAKFILIVHNSAPISLLSKELLNQFEGNQKLSDLIEKLPALLITDKLIDTLEIEDLQQYFLYINETKAEGIILCNDNKILGVLSRESIVKSLEDNIVYGLISLPGGINSPAKGFICKKCSPPTYRFPREGHNPLCPKNPLHGEMEYLE